MSECWSKPARSAELAAPSFEAPGQPEREELLLRLLDGLEAIVREALGQAQRAGSSKPLPPATRPPSLF